MLTDEDRDLVTSQLSTSGARTYHKTAPDPEDRTYVFERRTIMPPEVAAIEEARDEAYDRPRHHGFFHRLFHRD